MALKERERALAYGVVGVVVLWVLVRGVFVPFQEKLATLDRALALERARFQKATSLRDHSDVITREYAKYETYFSLRKTSDEENVAAFLKEIEKVSRDTQLTLLDMKPQTNVEEDKFSRQYAIVVKADTEMPALVRFLHALHHSPLLFSVEKMVLVPKGEETFQLSATLTVVGVVFT